MRARAFFRLAALLVVAFTIVACRAKPGDACTPGHEVCDGTSGALACIDGKVTALACRGPAGCTRENDSPRCDNTRASVGDACPEERDVACDIDGHAMLTCRAHKFVMAERCRGERACVAAAGRVTCDVGLSDPGDPCLNDGNRACSADLRAMLVCDQGTFRVDRACPQGCTVHGDVVSCAP